MDIHKPKPWHGVREFLKEYLIVVVGVLTALGAEQIAEVFHRDTEVREARAALHEEIKADASIILWGLEEDKCLLGQLPAYAAWARGGAKPPALRTALPEFGTSTWDTVKTSAVPHMPLQERLAVARFFDGLNGERGVIDVQRSSGLVLFGANERDMLNPEDAGRVLDAVAVERQITHFHRLNGAELLTQAAAMGIRPPPLAPDERAELLQLCGQGGSNST